MSVDTAYISQLKNPNNPKNIGEKLARRTEEALKLPRGWMDQPHHDSQSVNDASGAYNLLYLPDLTKSNVEPALNPRGGRVPIISWVQAGHAAEAVDLYEPGHADDWIQPTCHTKAHTYALRVQGDSMAPDFKQGMILIVEPEMDYCCGDFVIAKNGDDEATFKQYIRDAGKEYLKPLNPQYPIIEIGSYKIIGVVREVIRQFR
ncbi:MAG: S24 family peptidase [Thiomicrospira sp.]|nr:S24 family peptidase [Thiomicrospira sp.]